MECHFDGNSVEMALHILLEKHYFSCPAYDYKDNVCNNLSYFGDRRKREL